MASLGSASILAQAAPKAVAADLTPTLGTQIDTGIQIATASVTPKRYVRLAGVAVPIQ